ncbi:MAG TPA: hypothetical protein VGI19_19930 [Candidatus Cybelea sp.]
MAESLAYDFERHGYNGCPYANGRNQVFFDSPKPHRSCAGGKVGSGLTR